MRSSTSSSDEYREPIATRPGFVRQTASDRPGVAQPVPERDIPDRAWGPIWIGAVLLAVLLTGAWEWHWRAYGVTPSYRNSDGQWAQQRRRIDHGEGDALVLIGSSRTLFDMQLPVWKQVTGEQPIQLSLEGTSSLPALEDLAADPKFHGQIGDHGHGGVETVGLMRNQKAVRRDLRAGGYNDKFFRGDFAPHHVHGQHA